MIKNISNRLLAVVSLVFALGAIVIMFFPTWTVGWMSDPNNPPTVPITSDHRWFAGVLFGNASFAPMICMLLTIVALIVLVSNIIKDCYSRIVAGILLTTFILLMVFGFNENAASYLNSLGRIVPILLGMSAVFSFISTFPNRRKSRINP